MDIYLFQEGIVGISKYRHHEAGQEDHPIHLRPEIEHTRIRTFQNMDILEIGRALRRADLVLWCGAERT